MKKTHIYIIMSLLAVLFMLPSCGSEDALEPSGADDNHFAVDPNATDEVSVLRREFYESTGIHLLFTDTLRNEYVGKDSEGKDIYKTETVDLGYNLTGYPGNAITYDEIEGIADKRKAVAALQKYILRHFPKGSALRPYSILLTNGLYSTDSYGTDEEETVISIRCVGMDMTDIINAENDEEAQSAANSICKSIVSAKYDYRSDEADAFCAVSDAYYDEKIVNYIEDWDRSDITLLYDYGFIDYYESWRGASRDLFQYERTDFESFYDAVMDMSEDDFLAVYGDYPVVLQKYYIMRNTIISLGYEF